VQIIASKEKKRASKVFRCEDGLGVGFVRGTGRMVGWGWRWEGYWEGYSGTGIVVLVCTCLTTGNLNNGVAVTDKSNGLLGQKKKALRVNPAGAGNGSRGGTVLEKEKMGDELRTGVCCTSQFAPRERRESGVPFGRCVCVG
jgi:hypothetical protein